LSPGQGRQLVRLLHDSSFSFAESRVSPQLVIDVFHLDLNPAFGLLPGGRIVLLRLNIFAYSNFGIGDMLLAVRVIGTLHFCSDKWKNGKFDC